MLKKLLSGLAAASVLVSGSAAAMTAAIYDITPGIEVLKSVSTTSADNWTAFADCRMNVTDGSLRIRGTGSTVGADMLAGGDLYAETASSKAMFWDFETDNDVFNQANDAALLKNPADVPEGRMANFYSTSSYWVRPSIEAFSDSMYTNATTGASYTGERTPSAPGSTKVGRVGLGANDWNYATLGMKVKLSAEKFTPGETYVLSFYTMNNTGERDMYVNVTKPSQTEPTGSGAINWLPSSVQSIGKVRQYWTELKTEITPEAEDFENGYAMLWIGETAAPCTRTERLYLDNICLVRKSDLSEQELTFTAKVKGESSVSVAGNLQGEKLFGTSVAASEEWKDISITFTVDRTGDFYIGELRGKPDSSSRDKFKVSFSGSGTFYVKDVSIQKVVESERFDNVESLVGYKISAAADVYASDAGLATAVLAIASADGEQLIEEKEYTLTAGTNTISLAGSVPSASAADAQVAIYIKDGDGSIISERKQSVAQLYRNGANLVGSSLKAGGGIEIWGAGGYLLEFTTEDTSAKTAAVEIGGITETAAVNNGIGVCEIEITEAALGSITADTVVSITGVNAENITLKKVME